MRFLIHFVSELQLLLLVDLTFHIVVLDLSQQRLPRILLVYLAMRILILCPCSILNWKWIEVSGAIGINVRVELVSLGAATAGIHFDKVQRAADRSMHILELPIALSLLTLRHLSLPDLSIIGLSILLGLCSHLKVVLVVLDLCIELCLLDVALLLQLVDLVE